MNNNKSLRPETIAAHSVRAVDAATGAVSPPLYLSTTYARDENYQPKLKENYQRNGTPNLWQLEETLTQLEKGAAVRLFQAGSCQRVAIALALEEPAKRVLKRSEHQADKGKHTQDQGQRDRIGIGRHLVCWIVQRCRRMPQHDIRQPEA